VAKRYGATLGSNPVGHSQGALDQLAGVTALRPPAVRVRIPRALRKVNQTGALGSPAKRCAGNTVSFDYCTFRSWRMN
jgi:hypothetical protein